MNVASQLEFQSQNVLPPFFAAITLIFLGYQTVSQRLSIIETVLEFLWAKLFASSSNGMKRVRSRRIWQMWAAQKPQSTNICPRLFVHQPPVQNLCSICSSLSLSEVKAQYKWADITRPQARGFVTNRDGQRPPDNERMATGIKGDQKIAGLQKLEDWRTVSAGQFWDHNPRSTKQGKNGKSEFARMCQRVTKWWTVSGHQWALWAAFTPSRVFINFIAFHLLSPNSNALFAIWFKLCWWNTKSISRSREIQILCRVKKHISCIFL